MKISENRLVTLEYRLKVKNDDGELELMEYTGDDCREGIVSPVAID